MRYFLKPGAAWIVSIPSPRRRQGIWIPHGTNQLHLAGFRGTGFPTRDEALAVAAGADLSPVAETYGPGYTEIFVAPVEFDGVKNWKLETCHNRARTFGKYEKKP